MVERLRGPLRTLANRGRLIEPGTFATLVAVWRLEAVGTVTVRKLMKLRGVRSPLGIVQQLNRLQAAGLICREPRQGGTIRSTCRLELLEPGRE